MPSATLHCIDSSKLSASVKFISKTAVSMWQIIFLPLHLVQLFPLTKPHQTDVVQCTTVFIAYGKLKYPTTTHLSWGKVSTREALNSMKRVAHISLANNYLSKRPHSLNIPITKGFLFEWGIFYVVSTRLLIKIHTPNEFFSTLIG